MGTGNGRHGQTGEDPLPPSTDAMGVKGFECPSHKLHRVRFWAGPVWCTRFQVPKMPQQNRFLIFPYRPQKGGVGLWPLE